VLFLFAPIAGTQQPHPVSATTTQSAAVLHARSEGAKAHERGAGASGAVRSGAVSIVGKNGGQASVGAPFPASSCVSLPESRKTSESPPEELLDDIPTSPPVSAGTSVPAASTETGVVVVASAPASLSTAETLPPHAPDRARTTATGRSVPTLRIKARDTA
jgi:hypothetical protein